MATAIPAYPMALATAWLLQFTLARGLDIDVAARSLLVVLTVSFVVTVISARLVGHRGVGGLIALTVLVALLKASSPLVAGVLVIGVLALLLVLRAERAGRMTPRWNRFEEVTSAISLVMVALLLAQYGIGVRDRPSVPIHSSWYAPVPAGGSRPNLYLVLADGHGRQDVLATYGYDASGFATQLEAMGFDVARRSRANYLFTQLSVASMVSGMHLTDMGHELPDAVDTALLNQVLRSNPTQALLRRIGYRTIGIPSGYDHLRERTTDIVLDSGGLTEFEFAALRSTALGQRLAPQVRDLWLRTGDERTISALRHLAGLADDPIQRQAVFVHIPMPHPPFSVNRDCQRIPRESDSFGAVDRGDRAGTARSVALYAEQVECVDQRLLQALRHVVDADPTAIVLLVSDHGPEERLDWWEPLPVPVAHRAANLVALRAPGHEGLLSEDVTLVNVLPSVFNAVFGTDLPIRPNDVWFGPRRQDRTITPVE